MPQLATICYIDNGKELLMLHRNKKPNDVHEGKWIGVGGKLERGEMPQECAAREILEETGLKATQQKRDHPPKLACSKPRHREPILKFLHCSQSSPPQTPLP